MKRYITLVPAVVCYCIVCNAEQVVEIYPGKLVDRQITLIESSRFIQSNLDGMHSGNVALKFLMYEKQTFEEKPIFEKVIVEKQKGDLDDPGTRTVVQNEFIEGEMTQNQKIVEVGPVTDEQFSYLGTISRTNENGLMIDDRQVILAQFDNLKRRSLTIPFSSTSNDQICTVELLRSELYSQLGIFYDTAKSSHPENLDIVRADWDKQWYIPGEFAELTLTIKNSGSSGNLYRVFARSISRWQWIDGRMFYFGDLKPGEEKTFNRRFLVPEGINGGGYYLRLGFNEYSGAKPQVMMSINIRD